MVSVPIPTPTPIHVRGSPDAHVVVSSLPNTACGLLFAPGARGARAWVRVVAPMSSALFRTLIAFIRMVRAFSPTVLVLILLAGWWWHWPFFRLTILSGLIIPIVNCLIVARIPAILVLVVVLGRCVPTILAIVVSRTIVPASSLIVIFVPAVRPVGTVGPSLIGTWRLAVFLRYRTVAFPCVVL